MQHKFIDTVERLPGRDVLAFMSNHHIGPDIKIELFLLQPKPGQTAAAIDDYWPRSGSAKRLAKHAHSHRLER